MRIRMFIRVQNQPTGRQDLRTTIPQISQAHTRHAHAEPRPSLLGSLVASCVGIARHHAALLRLHPADRLPPPRPAAFPRHRPLHIARPRRERERELAPAAADAKRSSSCLCFSRRHGRTAPLLESASSPPLAAARAREEGEGARREGVRVRSLCCLSVCLYMGARPDGSPGASVRCSRPLALVAVLVCACLFMAMVAVTTTDGGAATSTSTRTTSAAAMAAAWHSGGRGSSRTTAHASDAFRSSKRRIPKGPDPIHNRRAGKTTIAPRRRD
ncbi:hypothetical protein BS78_09G194600 [Paspalum vaginatum]|nr:hypothetical protein BS78_09G194600 [Paspalum vaginatum]